jgi:hypothetical protein
MEKIIVVNTIDGETNEQSIRRAMIEAGLFSEDANVTFVGLDDAPDIGEQFANLASLSESIKSFPFDDDERTQAASIYQITRDMLKSFADVRGTGQEHIDTCEDRYLSYTMANLGFTQFIDAMSDLLQFVAEESPLFDEPEPVNPLIAGPEWSYDLYSIMGDNVEATLEWFQYEQVPAPEEDSGEALYYQRPYGDGVFGFVTLEGGIVGQRVIRPSVTSIGPDQIANVLSCKRDFLTIQNYISPMGPLAQHELTHEEMVGGIREWGARIEG